MYLCIRRTLSRSLRRSRGCGADGFAPTYVIPAFSAVRFPAMGSGPLAFLTGGPVPGPITPGAAGPGEARACRRTLRYGSWLRAQHILWVANAMGGLARRWCGLARPAAADPEPPYPCHVSGKDALNNYFSPVCVHPVHAPIRPCPPPARACIVLPRAAPQWGGRANPENRILRKTQEVRQTI